MGYYAVGGLVYDELEGWGLLDTTYFLTVTITTVGYGDFCPETPEGKLFTVVYCLVGIIFVFAALSPLVDALVYVKELLLRPITPPAWDDPVWEDDDLTLDDLRSRGNWRFKFGAALAGPAIVYALGLFISFFVMGLGAVDGVYWSTITMTTVGYGDLSASTWPQELVLILYLPMAVAALADSIGVMQTLATTKKLCMTDFASRADVLLLGEAGGADPNPDETLTEAEFLISVLKEEGLVDEMTITAIRLQFQHITRHDTGPADSKVLNDKVLFAELRSQGRIAQRGGGAPPVTAAGYKVDRVDLSAADGGFAEWKQAYWLPRIYDGETHGIGYIRLDPTRASSSAPPGGGARWWRRSRCAPRRRRAGDARAGDARGRGAGDVGGAVGEQLQRAAEVCAAARGHRGGGDTAAARAQQPRLADQGDARAARLLLERAHHLPAVGGRRRALRPPRRLPRDGDAAGAPAAPERRGSV